MSIRRRRLTVIFTLCLTPCLFLIPYFSVAQTEGMTGKDFFRKHCAACPPDRGNILNPLQTLHRKHLQANGFITPQDIVNKMRNPEAFSPHLDK